MGRHILALDQGTTSLRAILFDRQRNIVAMEQKEFAQHYPQSGWVEPGRFGDRILAIEEGNLVAAAARPTLRTAHG
jgi:glycerol kinase